MLFNNLSSSSKTLKGVGRCRSLIGSTFGKSLTRLLYFAPQQLSSLSSSGSER